MIKLLGPDVYSSSSAQSPLVHEKAIKERLRNHIYALYTNIKVCIGECVSLALVIDKI